MDADARVRAPTVSSQVPHATPTLDVMASLPPLPPPGRSEGSFGSDASGPGGSTPEERRARQVELYGATLDAITQSVAVTMGLGPGDVARIIGVSGPMFTAVHEARRVRLGNPAAIARLAMLQEFAEHLRTGQADPEDVPLTLEQIRASTGLLTLHGRTVQASHPSARASYAGPPAPQAPPVPPVAAAPVATPPAAPTRTPPLGLTLDVLLAARAHVAAAMPPTPTYRWPLLEQATGTPTWVKHENHTPTGAFKVRGGLNHLARLMSAPDWRPAGIVSATRGNHGQSLAYAARAFGLPVTIVVPEGNSPDKNAAMEGWGARLVVHGDDFEEARQHAAVLAREEGLTPVPAFHPWLVAGVASYALELHEQVPGLETVYVPVGMGSGIAANILVRDLLGLRCEVVGVVAEGADAYARSFEAGEVVTTPTADTFVDGVACRTPDPHAFGIIRGGAARIVRVSETQAAEAMALMFRTTHNLAEPAGSLALAGLLADTDRAAGRNVAVVHTGGNCDRALLERALSDGVPTMSP